MACCSVFCSGLCWRWLGTRHGNSQCRAQRQTIVAENLAAAFFSPARLAAKTPPSKPPCWRYSPRRLNGEPVKGLLRAVAALFAKRPSLGACAKSLPMCASATNGRYRSAHGSQGCPCLGKGCNKEHGHWLPCPKVCRCKRQHLPCCQCLPGRQPARSCSVFRALRLAATAFAKQRARHEDFEQALKAQGKNAACANARLGAWKRPNLAHGLNAAWIERSRPLPKAAQMRPSQSQQGSSGAATG